ncbi:MAG TPA: ABC transporter permease subunit [Acetobacteraceae bacterium]|nr:ABC transporter permease subunit [Acetobacteraceae bacterium]
MSTVVANVIVPRRSHGLLGAFERAAVNLLVVAGAALIGVPLALTIYLSLFDEKLILFPPRGYTLSWYPAIIPNFGGPLLVSAELAIVAVAGSLLLGVPAGIALSRYRARVTGAIAALLLAPITFPGIALSLAIYVFLILIEQHSGVQFVGFLGLVLAYVLITTPWVVRLCLASLANHDRAAEEAATSLGAAPLTVIWRVTLPAMRPGIIAAALFAFIISFDNLEMGLFLAAPGVTTLPVAILQYLEYHIDPLVAAVAVAQMVIVGASLLVLDRLVRFAKIVQ